MPFKALSIWIFLSAAISSLVPLFGQPSLAESNLFALTTLQMGQSSTSESNVFSLDTRQISESSRSESNVFSLDTRQISESSRSESNVFVLDTRLTYTVSFDLGAYGTRSGGGALEQTVSHGDAASAPTLAVANGWVHSGWSVDYSSVTADLTVEAQYTGADATLVATTKALQSGYSGIPLVPGDRIQYSVTIANNGTVAATEIDVSGLIPNNTVYVAGSLTADGVSSAEALEVGSTLRLNTLAGGASVVLVLDVTVASTLPNNAVWIESAVQVDSLQSATTEYSDNDPSGHCGVVDNGLDHASDAGLATDDDDPTRLPMQASV